MSFDENNENNLTVLIQKFKENFPVDYWKKCCFFVEKDIELIHKHWLKFKPPEKGHFYALAILYFIVMVVGSLGNLTVIILYWRGRSLRTPANTLIVNLAFSDLIMMCMIPIFLYNTYHFGPALGNTGCKFYGFLGGISGTVSICLLSAISFDRFYVIKYPLTRQPSYTRIKMFVLICWIYGAVFSLIPVFDFGLGTYVPEAYLISCSFEYLTDDPHVKNFIFSFFVAAWVVPFCLIFFSYISIVYVLFSGRHAAMSTFGNSYRHIKKKQKIEQEVKVAITVLIVICVWFVAWTPYAIVSLLGIFGREDLITPLNSMIPAVFCKSASCLDPYIYALTHSKFKDELQKLLKKTSSRNIQSRAYSITTSRKCDKNELDRDSVVEEMIMVNLGEYRPYAQWDKASDKGRKPQQTVASQPSWWARPSFTDDSSLAKARKLVRGVSSIKVKGNEE